MALKPTTEKMEEAVSQFLQEGESLKTVGWASVKGTKYFYVALTDRRIIMVRLSFTYKVKGEESIPLDELVEFSTEKDTAETVLLLKAKGGKAEAFRFPSVIGISNREVPEAMVEMLKTGV